MESDDQAKPLSNNKPVFVRCVVDDLRQCCQQTRVCACVVDDLRPANKPVFVRCVVDDLRQCCQQTRVCAVCCC